MILHRQRLRYIWKSHNWWRLLISRLERLMGVKGKPKLNHLNESDSRIHDRKTDRKFGRLRRIKVQLFFLTHEEFLPTNRTLTKKYYQYVLSNTDGEEIFEESLTFLPIFKGYMYWKLSLFVGEITGGVNRYMSFLHRISIVKILGCVRFKDNWVLISHSMKVIIIQNFDTLLGEEPELVVQYIWSPHQILRW